MGATITDAEVSESGGYILRRIPGWMPTDRSTGNFKLLDTVGHAVDRLDEDIDSLDKATTVQDAETVDQLEQLAKLVDMPSKQGEDREKYRSRLIAEFQQMTNEGSAGELIRNTATILDVDPETILFRKDYHGKVDLHVPGNALDALEITNDQFITIVGELVAAGFRVKTFRKGTFTYISEEDYKNGNSKASRGYDGLDSNGDPKGNGGTYAGLIE